MRIVFLDIDGVFNNKTSMNNDVLLLPEKVLQIRELLERANAQIVICSEWRKWYSIRELNILLHSAGLGYYEASSFSPILRQREILDVTPVVGRYTNRGDEITKWKEDNKHKYNITSYVILDDNNWYNEDQQDNLILIDPEFGLLETDVEKAIGILNNGIERSVGDDFNQEQG